MAKKKKAASAKKPAGASASESRNTPRKKLPFPHGASMKDTGPAGQNAQAGTRQKQTSSSSEPDYYKLKYQAVEDLVTASPENSPPVSKQELRKYHAGPKIKLADWVKAILLKFWFAGVICYFFIWGLSTFRLNQWDLILILGIALGGATHLLTNNIYRFIAKQEGVYDRWMMFPGKSLAFLPLDILYAMVLILLTMMTYNGLNLLLAGPDAASPAVGVEPILFGILVTLWDLLFLGMKRMIKRIVADARGNVDRGHA